MPREYPDEFRAREVAQRKSTSRPAAKPKAS
jgi:hypothetical protein